MASDEVTKGAEAFRLTDSQTTLFDKPDAASTVLAQLPNGALITVFGTEGDFLRVVTADDKFGYIPGVVSLAPVELPTGGIPAASPQAAYPGGYGEGTVAGSHMILSTTHELQGQTILEYLGIVVGESIIGTGIFRDIGAGLTDIIGGRSYGYEAKMQQARDMALQEMVHRAQALMGNAVVGVDIDYEVVGDNMMMVSASGTAVRLAPEEAREVPEVSVAPPAEPPASPPPASEPPATPPEA